MLWFGLLFLLVHHVWSASIIDDVNASKWVKDVLEKHEIQMAANSGPDLDPTDDAANSGPDLDPTDDAGDATSLHLDPPVPTVQAANTPSTSLDPSDEVANNSSLNLDPSDVAQTIDCLMEDGTVGVCLQYYQCDENRTIIEDGSTIIDFRESSSCPSYLEVCCRHGIPDTFKDIIASGSTAAQSDTVLLSTPSNSKKASKDECGWNNPGTSIFRKSDKQRIFADYGEFPWIVAIIKKSETNVWSPNDYIGGGSIIHPSVVVTAAHKVDQRAANEVKCRGGEWDTQTTNEVYPFQERDVKKIALHPKFFKTSLYNDAALLFLEKPFDLGNAPHMGIACLSSVPPTPGEECFTMGWGKDFSRTDEYAIILKKIPLPLVSAETCESQLKKTRLGSFFRLHKSLTCAGGEKGVDACQGDGGSPLVCPVKIDGDRVRYAVVGIVAFGIGCGKVDVPGLYVNVSEVYPWINKAMADEGYGDDTYSI